LAQQKPKGTAFVIGEGGLLTALHENGYAIVDKDPDYVVVGEGRTISFELVEAALKMILGGAKLVATNLDPNGPVRIPTTQDRRFDRRPRSREADSRMNITEWLDGTKAGHF
jgi:ribonucleotide monophosphatase NagD (HAD superfamily)